MFEAMIIVGISVKVIVFPLGSVIVTNKLSINISPNPLSISVINLFFASSLVRSTF